MNQYKTNIFVQICFPGNKRKVVDRHFSIDIKSNIELLAITFFKNQK